MENNSKFMDVKGIKTHYHEQGSGKKIVLIHGSGPGVSAWANWRLTYPILSEHFHLFAPDIVGFGYTERPESVTYTLDLWVDHLIGFIESVSGGETVHLIGNSLGGALALQIAHRRPDLIDKMVLMGAVGISFPISEGLDKVWGYEPSVENMKKILDIFTYDSSFITDDLAKLRYEASIQPGFQEAFSSMFPEPRQRHVEALALTEEEIKNLSTPTLLIHGREDQVIPYEETTLKIFKLLPDAELHVFSKCGHWTQIEKTVPFCDQVTTFFKK